MWVQNVDRKSEEENEELNSAQVAALPFQPSCGEFLKRERSSGLGVVLAKKKKTRNPTLPKSPHCHFSRAAANP